MPSTGRRLKRSPVGRFARVRPFAAFAVFALAWTWGYGALAIAYVDGPTVVVELDRVPAIWGPLLAAAAVVWLNGGSLRAWAGQATRWRVAPRWYAVAFVLPVALTELSTLVAFVAGTPVAYGGLQPPWLYAAGFLLILLAMGGLEEFGWRGFAQPILQERYSALAASLVVGATWAVWHYYLFVFDVAVYANVDVGLFTLRLVTISVVYVWLYNGTGGSVLVAMVYHAAGNLAAVLEPAGDVPPWLDAVAGYPLLVAVQVVIVGVVVAVHGPRWLADSRPRIDASTLLGR
jgi:membrane protease YdiL (CAAX protease family)